MIWTYWTVWWPETYTHTRYHLLYLCMYFRLIYGFRGQVKPLLVNQIKNNNFPTGHFFMMQWRSLDHFHWTFNNFIFMNQSTPSPCQIYPGDTPSNLRTMLHNVDNLIVFGETYRKKNYETQNSTIFCVRIKSILYVYDKISTKIIHFIFLSDQKWQR